MHCYRISALLACICLATPGLASTAIAQTAARDTIEIPDSESGKAYRDAVRRSRVDTELLYLSPQADETLPRDTPETAPAAPRVSADVSRYVLIIVLIAVLAVLLLFARRIAPGTTISMRSPQDRLRNSNRRNGQSAASSGPADSLSGSAFLNELRMMADRRAALILLSKRALELALHRHNMPLGRSQTAREILRRLPRSWHHHAALSKIVGFEERVQFGGHDLPEAVFQESLNLAEPMFAEPPP